MSEVADLAGIYRRLVASRVRAQLQYRLSFVLDIVGSALLTVVDFVEIAVIFHQVPQLRGWSLGEVAFLYGVAGTTFALTDMTVGHLDQLHEHIRFGTFDVFLVRPLGSLFQILSSDFALRHIGRVLQALTVLAVAIARVDIHWTPGRVLMIPLMMATGGVIFASIWITGSSLTFWTVNSSEVTNAFTYGGSLLASYPIEVFGVWLRRLLAFAVPLAFVSYFPSLYVLGRDDPFGLPDVLRFLGVPVAAAAALVASGVWRMAVRHYRSTGS